jgi:periplasmic protein TonB
MHDVAPGFTSGARATALAAVAAFHAAVIAAFLLAPSVRERLVFSKPVFVEFLQAAREQPPATRPVPPPALHDPAAVIVPLPAIALVPEVAVAPPPDRAPSISGPMIAAADAPGTIEAPRYDMSYLNNPAPAYPNLSRRMKEQGRVVLRVLVSASGIAENVEVRSSSGSERLDHAAIDAVRRWRFAPARHGAETVAAWALVPILFQLDA